MNGHQVGMRGCAFKIAGLRRLDSSGGRPSFSWADSSSHLIVVRSAECRPVSHLWYGPIKHRAKNRTMQYSDRDLSLISGGDVVHYVDVKVFRVLSRRFNLAIFDRNLGTASRRSVCLNLDLARRAGDVIGKTLLVNIFGLSSSLILQLHDVLDTCALDLRVSQQHLAPTLV